MLLSGSKVTRDWTVLPGERLNPLNPLLMPIWNGFYWNVDVSRHNQSSMFNTKLTWLFNHVSVVTVASVRMNQKSFKVLRCLRETGERQNV